MPGRHWRVSRARDCGPVEAGGTFCRMRWTNLAVLCVLVPAAVVAQPRDYRDYRNWRYRGDARPDFHADSAQCSTQAQSGTEVASRSNHLAAWSSCIAEANWVRVRRFDPVSQCEPLKLTAGAVPPGFTEAGTDSLLRRLRGRVLERWVPSATRRWNDWTGRVAIQVTVLPDSVITHPVQALEGAIDEVPLSVSVRRSHANAEPLAFLAVAEYSHVCPGFRERPPAGVSEVFSHVQVERQVQADRSNRPPRHPGRGVVGDLTGDVVVTFVVDTLRRAEMESFVAIRSPHPAFTKAVHDQLPKLRYFPAEIAGEKVRQLFLTAFQFRLGGQALGDRLRGPERPEACPRERLA